MARGQKPLYVGTNRIVAALDPNTGEELWRTKLPNGTIGSAPSIVIKGQYLYIGCYGYAYCLDKRSGEIIWENGLPKMGYHTVLLTMEGAAGASSQDAAVAAAQRRRQQQAAAAGAASGR